MPTSYPEYNNTDKKRWYEYNEDEPLPELPWINNNHNQYDQQKLGEDDGWTIVTKKTR